MRISDWSSDVCSSDLNGRRFAAVCPTKEGHAVPDAAAPLETLDALVRAVDRCTRCPPYRHATQGVAGEGPASGRIMLVGEQPGEQEDVRGRTFVGRSDEHTSEIQSLMRRSYAVCYMKHKHNR